MRVVGGIRTRTVRPAPPWTARRPKFRRVRRPILYLELTCYSALSSVLDEDGLADAAIALNVELQRVDPVHHFPERQYSTFISRLRAYIADCHASVEAETGTSPLTPELELDLVRVVLDGWRQAYPRVHAFKLPNGLPSQ